MATLAKLVVALGLDSSDYEKDIRSTKSRTADFAKSLGKTAALGAAAAGVALVGAGVASLKMAADFEESMREVNTMMGATEQEFGKLGDDILAMSDRVGIAATDLSKGLYQVVSAGYSGAEGLRVLEQAAKASIAGVTSTEIAVDGLTTVLNAFKIPAEDVERVSDILFTTVKGGKTTFEELSKSMFNVAPIAASMGVGIEDVAAALATMTKQGVPTSVATTQLRQVMVEMLKPGKDLAKAIKTAGFESGKAMLAEGGLAAALDHLSVVAKESDTEIAKLFGSVEAGSAAMALTGENAAMAFEDLDKTLDSAGATQEAYEEVNKGFNRQLERLMNTLRNVGIRIGRELLPFAVALVDGLSALADMAGRAANVFSSEWDAAGGDFSVFARNMAAKAEELGPELWAKAQEWGQKLWAWIEPQIPVVLGKLGELTGALLGYLGEHLPDWIVKLGEWGNQLVFWIVDHIPDAIAAMGDLLGKLGEWLDAGGRDDILDFAGRMGKAMVTGIFNQLEGLGERLWAFIKKVLQGLATNVAAFFAGGAEVAAGAPALEYQHGGIIAEPVWGMGLRSGRSYSFGEAGIEKVTPLGKGANVPAIGSLDVNVNLTPDLEDIRRQVMNMVVAATDDALRRAGFGGAFVTSGAFTPG